MTYEMAKAKSVTFSPILELASDEVSVGSSETDLFPSGMKFEDAYTAGLSKSAKKYELPTEDERRVPRGRKIALLTLGFILLLGIGGVVIYLVTGELHNREQHYHSGAMNENKTGFASGNTSKKESTISMGSFNIIKPSSEFSKTQLPWHSVHKTASESEKATPVARTLTLTTVVHSSGLVPHLKTKKRNAAKSTSSTQFLAIPRMTTVHWLSGQDPTKLYSTSQLTKDTSAPGERKITTSYLDHRTSTWNDDDDDDVNKGKTFTTSGFVASVSFFDTIRYTGYLTKNGANSSVFQNASSNALSWSTQKISTTGTFSTTPQDTGTLISGATSSGSTNVWPSFSTAIRTSSESKYLKSGESTDFQITIRRSEHSNLGQPGSPTVTTAIVQSPSKTVNLTIRGTASTLSPTTKSSLPSSSSYKQSDSTNFVTSLSRMLPGGTFSHGWLSSESISPVTLDGQYSTMIKENISTRKSSFSDHNKSTRSMSVSPTPAVRFALELVSSSSKVLKTSQSALAKKLISTDSKMVSSKSLRGDFSTVVMTSFPSLSLSNNQGSAVVKFLTPTKPASFAVTQGSNPSTLGARSTNRAFLQTEKQSLVTSTLPWYTRNNGISTARVVTSLRTFPSSRLQRRLSISQSRSEIKATSFGSAAMLNSSSKSSSLSSSPGGLRSLPDAMSSSYGSISSRASYDYLPSFASEATTNGVSSWIATQNISSRSPSSNSKPISTSRKMSTQHWHAGQSTDSLRYLNPNSRVKEFLPANLTIKTTNPAHGHQQTLHKITSVALALATVTSSLIITTLSLKQPTALSQSLQSITKSLPPVRLTPRRMSSHSKSSRLSNVISSMENLTSNKPLETSQHHSWYTQTGYTLAISTITRFSITTVMSNSRGISAAEPVSKTTISQLDDAGLSSNISSTLSDRSSERLTVMQSSKKGHSVLTMELHKTFQQILVSSSKDTPTNSTATQSFIATTSPSVQSRILLLDGSSASHITTLASRNKSLYVYNLTHSKFVLPMETVTIFPSPISTSTKQVKPLETTVSYSFSTVLTNYGPTTNSTAQFKIMDGSLVIRNRLFHENLSSPNTTMFKALADEVEEIIVDIVSLDAEVTSFRNGSIVANFYLLVASGSPFSDRDYADMLSQANETLWRGYQVTNITVILRVDSPRATARLHDGGGLSKAAVAAIFTVFSVLLIAVGCFGAYICKKKRLCERSRVKPADSPMPPSELEKIQPVRRGTWEMNDEPFLNVDVPKDPNYRNVSLNETLKMRVMERIDTQPDDPDLPRKDSPSSFEPEYANSEENNDSVTKNVHLSASKCVSSTMMESDYVDQAISGSSRNTYLNIASASTYSEDEC